MRSLTSLREEMLAELERLRQIMRGEELDLVNDNDENLLTKKYHPAVIKLGTGYAFHMIKHDRGEGDKWLLRGGNEIKDINAREQAGADAFHNLTPPAGLISRRKNRRTR